MYYCLILLGFIYLTVCRNYKCNFSSEAEELWQPSPLKYFLGSANAPVNCTSVCTLCEKCSEIGLIKYFSILVESFGP